MLQDQVHDLRMRLLDCQREYNAEKELRKKVETQLRIRGKIYDDILSATDGLKKWYFICSEMEKQIDDRLRNPD